MVHAMRKALKNEKGLTLIELLAVVVILGIIAAIAIPAIGGIIDNSKKDAHAANAIQMISSAKLAVTGDQRVRPTATAGAATGVMYISLDWLQANGYIEPMRDPDTDNYVVGTAATTAPSSTLAAGSHVQVTFTAATNQFTYAVFLVNDTRGRGVRGTDTATGALVADYVLEADVARGEVR